MFHRPCNNPIHNVQNQQNALQCLWCMLFTIVNNIHHKHCSEFCCLLIHYGSDVQFEGDKSTCACGAQYTVIVINMAARILTIRFRGLNVGFW